MPTFLFDSIVFGPVRSRRFGLSLGVNLLPIGSKVCTFDCIYCECGWTQSTHSHELPQRHQVSRALQHRLEAMRSAGQPLDAITFAGNGEPTLHPQFAAIIHDTLTLRNQLCPHARVAVLSNATYLHRPDVVEALGRVDHNVLKLDSAIDTTLNLLNQPRVPVSVAQVVGHLRQLNGRFALQTLFVRGEFKGQPVDNASPLELAQWLGVVGALGPQEVMIYSIARATPAPGLREVPVDELNLIGQRVRDLGIPAHVSG